MISMLYDYQIENSFLYPMQLTELKSVVWFESYRALNVDGSGRAIPRKT